MPKKRVIETTYEANVDGFTRNTRKAAEGLDRFEKRAKTSSVAIRSAFRGISAPLAGVLTAGAFVSMTKSAQDSADAIAKAAERTGFAIDSLQKLRFAGEQTGVSFGEMDAALARFTKRLGLARQGTGAAAKTYKKLAIDLSQNNEQVFRKVVDTLGDMDDATDRLALTTRLFGDDAQKLAATFKNGTSDLDDFAKQAEDLGLVLSDDLVNGAAEANDQLNIMNRVLDAQLTQTFLKLTPTIIAATKTFNSFINDIRRGFDVIDSYLEPKGVNKFNLLLARSLELTEQIGLQTAYIANFRGPEFAREDLLQDLSKLKNELRSTNEEVDRMREKNITELQSTPGAQKNEIVAPSPLAAVDKQADEELKRRRSAVLRSAKAAADRIKKEREESARLADEESRKLETLKRHWDGVLDPTIEFKEQLAEIDLIYEEGSDKWFEATMLVHEAMDNVLQKEGEVKEETDELQQVWDDLGGTFSSAFEDAVVSGGKFSEILRGLEQDIIRIFTRQLITKPIAAGISNLASGIFGGLFGSGDTNSALATVGPDQYQEGTDFVPRTGLAMLHRGEAVIPAEQNARGMMAEPNVNIVINEAPPGTTQQTSRLPNGEQLIEIIMGRVNREAGPGGSTNQIIGQSFGLRQAGISR